MATPALIPNDRDVYRGMRNANWAKHGVVNYKAYMLRPATPDFPPEQELSLGLTPASAVDELAEHHGVGQLSVAAIHELPHNLAVRPDPENAAKTELFGLPLFSEDPILRDLAVTIATDLAGLTYYIPRRM